MMMPIEDMVAIVAIGLCVSFAICIGLLVLLAKLEGR